MENWRKLKTVYILPGILFQQLNSADTRKFLEISWKLWLLGIFFILVNTEIVFSIFRIQVLGSICLIHEGSFHLSVSFSAKHKCRINHQTWTMSSKLAFKVLAKATITKLFRLHQPPTHFLKLSKLENF